MKKNVLIFFILSLISYKINGQILLSDSLVKNKSFQFAKFKGTSNTLATADNINSIITKFSGQQKDITSKEVFIEKDAFGKIHIKHQLFFRGIVIRGGDL